MKLGKEMKLTIVNRCWNLRYGLNDFFYLSEKHRIMNYRNNISSYQLPITRL